MCLKVTILLSFDFFVKCATCNGNYYPHRFIVAATALAIVSIQDLYNTISCTFCSPDEIKAQCQG